MHIKHEISKDKVYKNNELRNNEILLLNILDVDKYVNAAKNTADRKQILKTLIKAVKVLQEGNI